jgi:23S rRNA (uracil1939-C5)-methyltransferase
MEKFHVHTLMNDGRGLSKAADSKTLFIENALPGDDVEVEILKEKKTYVEAKLVRLHTSSPIREENPPCPYYLKGCGGCQLQHVKQDEILNFKRTWLLDALRRVGKWPQEALEDAHKKAQVEPLASTYYRRRVKFKYTKEGLGFYQRHSHKVIPIGHCLIAHPRINEFLSNFKKIEEPFKAFLGSEFLMEFELTVDDELHLFLRVLEAQGKGLKKGVKEIEGFLQKELGLCNEPQMSLKALDGSIVKVLKGSFVQGHKDAVSLYQSHIQKHLYDLLEKNKGEKNKGEKVKIIDLFAGYGPFTQVALQALKDFNCQGEIESVEISPYGANSLKAYLENPFLKDLANSGLKVYEKDVTSYLEDLTLDEDVIPIFIVNPPRTGMGLKASERLMSLCKKRGYILFLSCDGPTFARDTASLLQGQFKLEALKIFDAFPYTVHYETLAFFTKEDS